MNSPDKRHKRPEAPDMLVTRLCARHGLSEPLARAVADIRYGVPD